MLWNRSLVMKDIETETLWSHILGLGMRGKLEGKRLKTIPCDMVTWKAWKESYPDTTVLNLSRTNKNYTREFYRDPQRFVLGWVLDSGVFHCQLDDLKKHRIINCESGGRALVVSFDPESTSARLFDRKFKENNLTFSPSGAMMRDDKTSSLWDPKTGKALEGPLAGSALDAEVGIVSYGRVWTAFHPTSKRIQPKP